MCTRITHPIQVAEEDIICYKHIIRVSENLREKVSAHYVTSYRHVRLEFNTLITSELLLINGSVFDGLHAYVHESSARKEARHYGEVLVQCMIPKGSKYYLGISAGYHSIVANQLVYQRILTVY